MRHLRYAMGLPKSDILQFSWNTRYISSVSSLLDENGKKNCEEDGSVFDLFCKEARLCVALLESVLFEELKYMFAAGVVCTIEVE